MEDHLFLAMLWANIAVSLLYYLRYFGYYLNIII